MAKARICAGAIVALAALGASSAPALAQESAQYGVTHTYTFTPAGGIVSGQWKGRVFTRASSPGVSCSANPSAAMPAGTSHDCDSAAAGGATAHANSAVTTAHFDHGVFSGTIHVEGVVHAPVGGGAISAARARVRVHGGPFMRLGQVNLRVDLNNNTAFGTSTSWSGTVVNNDPIAFDVLDPTTGVHTRGILEGSQSTRMSQGC